MSGSPSSDQIDVVVVDDHHMFAEALRLALAETGIAVVAVAATAADAPRVVNSHRPEVVLLDYMLPDGDGVQTARAIKAICPEIPIIMLTGTADDRVLVQAVSAGCSGYLTKDQRVEELAAAVRAARDGATLISPATLSRLVNQLGGGTPMVGSDLSGREREVLELIAAGLANKEIAHLLGLSVHTVRNHVHSVISKLGAHSKLAAVAVAQREGILTAAPRRLVGIAADGSFASGD